MWMWAKTTFRLSNVRENIRVREREIIVQIKKIINANKLARKRVDFSLMKKISLQKNFFMCLWHAKKKFEIF